MPELSRAPPSPCPIAPDAPQIARFGRWQSVVLLFGENFRLCRAPLTVRACIPQCGLKPEGQPRY